MLKPFLVLIFGLLVTVCVAATLQAYLDSRNQQRFLRHVAVTHLAIGEEIETYTALLRATVGFFAGSQSVTLSEFKAYADQIDFAKNYPGLQGVGFSIFVIPDEVPKLEEKMRQYGYGNFKVWPQLPEGSHSIIFLEPLNDRNREAIGFNMYSEPIRRRAMERAIDTGKLAASGKVTLVQEIGGKVQAGFLIFFPFYKKNGIFRAVEERRRNFVGFVYSPIRIGDFISSILARNSPDIRISIYDGEMVDEQTLIYGPHDTRNGKGEGIARTLDIGGQIWTIMYRPGPEFQATWRTFPAAILFALGILVSLALGWLSWRGEQAKRNTLDSRLRLSRIIDNMNSFVGEMAPDGTVTGINQITLNVAGVKREDVIGKKMWECPWWSYDDAVSGRIRQACEKAREGQLVRFDEIAEIAAGRKLVVDYMMTPVTDASKKIVAIIPSGIDVTARRQAEDALRNSEEAFRGTFENAAVGIAHMAEDGHWLKVNNRLCEILGYTAEELYEKTFQDITYAEDLGPDLAQAQRMIAGEISSYQLEKRYHRKDGQIVWVYLTCSRAPTLYKGQPYFIAVIEDISERKALEQKLTVENDRKNRFLATLSHELRNPLAPISNAFSLLSMEGLPPDLQKELIDTGRRSTDHLVRLVNDLLDITRITRGKIKLTKQNINLVQVLKDAVGEAKFKIDEKGHELKINCAADDMVLGGDPARIRQIFSNILTNAAKYTPRGGQIEVICRKEKNMAVVTVQDNGPGIPPDMLEDIFEIFIQVEDSLHRSEAGLGIGLALVRELVNLHGGIVRAENRAEGGAKFTVYLPLLEGA